MVLQSSLINTVYYLLVNDNKWERRGGLLTINFLLLKRKRVGGGGGLIEDLWYFVEFNCHSCKQFKVLKNFPELLLLENFHTETRERPMKKNIRGLHVHVQEDPSLKRG